MQKQNQTDTIYANPHAKVNDFAFDENVVKVFANMIERSVPGYNNIIDMIGILAQKFVQKQSHCYDLGCSLGTATISILKRLKENDCKGIIAIDNSKPMIARCRENITACNAPIPVDIYCEDIRHCKISNASIVVLNFTLQFIPPDERLALLENISKGMLPGGILLLSEKIHFEDTQEDEQQIDWHHGFKKANGYSDLEVSQKRTALENVMILDTISKHHQRLKEAGFSQSHVWFQCFNFISMLAQK